MTASDGGWPAPAPGAGTGADRGEDYAPAVVSGGLAVAAGLLAVAAVAGTTAGAVVGLAGLAALGGGLLVGRGAGVTAGGALLFGGTLLAGASGGTAGVVLAGAVASLVAYDAGDRAVRLGRTLRRGADTVRVELVHLVGTLTAGALAGGLGLLVFEVHPRNAPALWLAATLAVAIALALVLRPSSAAGDPGA
jgi:hypothetical protein